MVTHAVQGWDAFSSLCDAPVNHIRCPDSLGQADLWHMGLLALLFFQQGDSHSPGSGPGHSGIVKRHFLLGQRVVGYSNARVSSSLGRDLGLELSNLCPRSETGGTPPAKGR